MLRHALLFAVLIAATTLPTGGCRSCSDCHDYDPPVANCDCPGGINRAGSNSMCGDGCECGGCGCSDGCESGQCYTEAASSYGAPSSCNCGNH
jgi:hypothetical protein